jgi:hypothetical protein
MDGAEWIDGFVDWQRPDALRILDFAHAAEYVSEIGQRAQAAGTLLADNWLQTQLHTLKHVGPAAVLHELECLRDLHPQLEELGKKLACLQKREARMQYPEYQAQGWPIGSGIVESGNKVVMQARLKGAGMHWEPTHVNPMLALRTSACNDRWNESWDQAQAHLQQQRFVHRQERQCRRSEQLLRGIQICLLLYQSRIPHPQPSALPRRSTSGSRSCTPRPSATHPWRKRLLAKK